MNGEHMESMYTIQVGLMTQELEIKFELRLKQNRTAEEWAGDDKRSKTMGTATNREKEKHLHITRNGNV